MTCRHRCFEADVSIVRQVDDDGALARLTAHISIRCLRCRELFVWQGVPAGGHGAPEPVVDASGTRLSAPLVPSSESEPPEWPWMRLQAMPVVGEG